MAGVTALCVLIGIWLLPPWELRLRSPCPDVSTAFQLVFAPGKRFEGKVVIVTGAASGIDEAMARRFAAEGAKVTLVDQDEERLTDRREGNTESHASSSRSAENPFIPITAKKELSGGHEHCFEGLGCSNPGV